MEDRNPVGRTESRQSARKRVYIVCACALLLTVVVTLLAVYLPRRHDQPSVNGKGVMLKATAGPKPIHSTIISFVEYENDEDVPGTIHLVYVNVKPEHITRTGGTLVPTSTAIDGIMSMAIYRRNNDGTGYDTPIGISQKMQKEVVYNRPAPYCRDGYGFPEWVYKGQWTREEDQFARYVSSWYSSNMETNGDWVYQLLTQRRFDEEEYIHVVHDTDYIPILESSTDMFLRVLVRQSLSIYANVTFNVSSEELVRYKEVVCPYLISKHAVSLYPNEVLSGKALYGRRHPTFYYGPNGSHNRRIKLSKTITPAIIAVDGEDVVVDDLCFVNFESGGAVEVERTIIVDGGGTLIFKGPDSATVSVIGGIIQDNMYTFSDSVQLTMGGKYYHLYILVVPRPR